MSLATGVLVAALVSTHPISAGRDADRSRADPAKLEAAFLAGMCAPSGADASEALETLDAVARVTPATEEAVVTAIRERSPWCRSWAAVALGRIRPMRAVPALPLLREALASQHPMLRFEAMVTLGRMGRLARPAVPELEASARADRGLAEIVASVLEGIRQRTPFDGRPFEGLRLMALGAREDAPVAYLLDEEGFVHEARGGTALLDGRIARLTPDAVEFEGERVTPTFEVLPHQARLALFERGAPAPIPVVASEHEGRPVSIHFDGDLGSFAAFVALYAPLNVIVEEGGTGPVRVAARQAPWDAVVEHALREAGVGHRIESYYLRLGAPDRLARHPRRPERKYAGAPITIAFRAMDMTTIERVFEEVGDVGIELPPGAHEPLTVYFTDVPWDEAFDMVAASRGWTTRREGRRLVAAPAGR